MCEKCDKLIEMIEQTIDGKSVVSFSFPNGEPELVSRTEDADLSL